jgi:hypothetical protein
MEGRQAATLLTANGCGGHSPNSIERSSARRFLGVAARTERCVYGAVRIPDASSDESKKGSMARSQSHDVEHDTNRRAVDNAVAHEGPVEDKSILMEVGETILTHE